MFSVQGMQVEAGVADWYNYEEAYANSGAGIEVTCYTKHAWEVLVTIMNLVFKSASALAVIVEGIGRCRGAKWATQSKLLEDFVNQCLPTLGLLVQEDQLHGKFAKRGQVTDERTSNSANTYVELNRDSFANARITCLVRCIPGS
jgi:hypothetical protein